LQVAILVLLIKHRGLFKTYSDPLTRVQAGYFLIRNFILFTFVGFVIVYLDRGSFTNHISALQALEISLKGLFGVSGSARFVSNISQERIEYFLGGLGIILVVTSLAKFLKPPLKETQLSSENKIFDKVNSYVVGAGIDLSKSNFEQTAEYGYFDSPYAGANIIGSGYFANETTHGNIDGKLDDRSAKLKSKSRTWSLFGTDTLSLTDNFHVTGSARYNYTNIKNTDQQIHHEMVSNVMTSTVDSNASLDGDHNYHRLNPSVGFNYSPVKSFTTFGGYNEGSRTPSQLELGCANPLSPCRLPNSMAGDPYLKQVVSKTFEAGFRGVNGNINYSAAVYSARNIDDIMFVAAGSSSTYGYFKNFGETQRRGLEASLSGRFDNLSVGGNYGYTDATYQSDETVGGAANSSNEDEKIQIRKGNHIPLVPKHVLKLFANYALNDKLSFGVDTRTVSSSYLRGNENNQHQPGEHDIDAVVTDLGGTTPESNYLSGGKTAGFTVVNFSAAFKPKEDWLIFGRINNVFDRQYETGGQLGANPYNNNGALQLSEYSYQSGSNYRTVGKTHTVGEAFVAPGAPRSVWVGVRWEFGGAKKSAE
jgi:outer membrane receptor protein involved in Fe transport